MPWVIHPEGEPASAGVSGVLERVAVRLFDKRLGVARRQFGDYLPPLAAPRKLLIGVLDPDDGDLIAPRAVDKAADIRDDRVAIMSSLNNAVLYIDDEECGVRPVSSVVLVSPLPVCAPTVAAVAMATDPCKT